MLYDSTLPDPFVKDFSNHYSFRLDFFTPDQIRLLGPFNWISVSLVGPCVRDFSYSYSSSVIPLEWILLLQGR